MHEHVMYVHLSHMSVLLILILFINHFHVTYCPLLLLSRYVLVHVELCISTNAQYVYSYMPSVYTSSY